MKILILSGSARPKSHTVALAKAVANEIKKQDGEVELIDLAELDLPPANPEFHKDPLKNPDPKVVELAKKANEADGFMLLSPVYHNSYSGKLKNALDNLAIAQFAGKPMAFGAQGGNRTTQPIDQLRIVARGLNAIGLPSQVCATEEDFEETDNGFELTNKKIKERVEGVAKRLVETTELFKGYN
ncbi:NAD(P)H-dependent oxidoreductase [Candidatus Saccharibacteria bacterium]|nr:NAD(P)H-dependent oxidoreductase [Candidatus Saccharibacteria bacterium]